MDFNPFAISTEQQRRVYWKSFERVRGEHLGWARRTFLKALAAGFRSWVIRFDTIQQPAEMLAYDIDPEPMERAYNDVYARVGGDFAIRTFRSLKSGGYYERKDYTESDYRAQMLVWLQTAAAERVTSVNATTNAQIRAKLQKILSDGITEGSSIPEVRRAITAEFRVLSGYRAERIARTEIVAASNKGALVSAQATGLELQKVWIATRDDRTRESHWSADGQTRDMGEDFSVDAQPMEAPGDPSAPPELVINCRCTVAFQRPALIKVE
jgi:SPP1 gp7 family putative phage head morphogenesis protein